MDDPAQRVTVYSQQTFIFIKDWPQPSILNCGEIKDPADCVVYTTIGAWDDRRGEGHVEKWNQLKTVTPPFEQ